MGDLTLADVLAAAQAMKRAAIPPDTQRIGCRAWGKPFYYLVAPPKPLWMRIRDHGNRKPKPLRTVSGNKKPRPPCGAGV